MVPAEDRNLVQQGTGNWDNTHDQPKLVEDRNCAYVCCNASARTVHGAFWLGEDRNIPKIIEPVLLENTADRRSAEDRNQGIHARYVLVIFTRSPSDAAEDRNVVFE